MNFANEYVSNAFDFWSNELWSDETKIELFGHNGIQKVWHKNGTANIPKDTVLTVKYGGGSMMIWGCFSAAGVENIDIIKGRMNAKKYKNILEKKTYYQVCNHLT